MQESRTIVFDFDDVLAKFNSELCGVLSRHLDDPNVVDDHLTWDCYHLADYYPQVHNFQSVFEQMEEEGIVDNLPLKPGFTSLMKHARSLGHRIVILTARGWMKDGHATTTKWLLDRGFEVDEIIVVPHTVSKQLFIPTDTWMYFDDNIDHVLSCARHCKAAFVVDKSWNRTVVHNVSNVYRLRDPDDTDRPIDAEMWFNSLAKMADL